MLISSWAIGPGLAAELLPLLPTEKTIWSSKYLILPEGNIIGGGRREFEPGFSVIGGGTIFANTVFLNGKLYPGYERPNPNFPNSENKNPIGTFTFGKDLRLGPRAIVNIDLRSPRHHDLVVVGGTAKLSGTLRVRFLGYQPKPGDRIRIVKAGRIIGGFSRVEIPGRGRYQVFFESKGRTGYLRVGGRGRG